MATAVARRQARRWVNLRGKATGRSFPRVVHAHIHPHIMQALTLSLSYSVSSHASLYDPGVHAVPFRLCRRGRLTTLCDREVDCVVVSVQCYHGRVADIDPIQEAVFAVPFGPSAAPSGSAVICVRPLRGLAGVCGYHFYCHRFVALSQLVDESRVMRVIWHIYPMWRRST